MAHKELAHSKIIVERNLALTGIVMRYLLGHPQVMNSLPEQFELVILPDDDPEIRFYNLELLDKYNSAGKSVVFARIGFFSQELPPRLFVPLPVAVS